MATLKVATGQRTLADRAFTAIHDEIVNGRFEPGVRLPIEDLAAALDMSPMPVREALRRLESVGLVEHIPHRGARVTELSIDDLFEVYEARLSLEPLAVRHAAERGNEPLLTEARTALSALQRLSPRNPLVWPAHTRFHLALYRAAGSRWLMRLIMPLWESSERYRHAIVSAGQVDLRQSEHAAILDAVVSREADRAATLMRDHLVTSANLVAEQMDGARTFALSPPADETLTVRS